MCSNRFRLSRFSWGKSSNFISITFGIYSLLYFSESPKFKLPLDDKNFPNFNTTELVVRIILYVFEILGILIFIETIILNCCGLERNVFLNITERGKEEANKIIKNVEEIDDSRKASELSVFSEETNNNEENKNDNEILH